MVREMSVRNQVSKQNLGKTHDVLRSQPSSSSSSESPLTLRWGDLEGHFVSLQNSIEARLKELEIRETQVNDRLKEIESKEKEMMKLGNIVSPGSMVSVDGQKLLACLSESLFEQQKSCERVHRALELSEDPGKLVLDAVDGFYCESLELGFVSSVRKRSCVVLLEQLAMLRPRIAPAVKAEAARLARKWRAKIRVEGQKCVLEVLGFLLLLGAYDLVDEFDRGETLSALQSIGQQNRQVGAGDLGIELSVAQNDPVSKSLVSQEPTQRNLEEDLELVDQIASAFTSTFEALKHFCDHMDGRNLKLFLCEYMDEHNSWSIGVRDALREAPDPAKLVLDAMPGFLHSQPKFHKNLSMVKVRQSCILLLEQLMTISPQISPKVREEALKLADEWRSCLGQIYQSPETAYGFLLFLATYGLKCNYDVGVFLCLLGTASQYKASPKLCQALGLEDKVEVLVQTLIQKDMLLDAVDCVYAYNLVDKFQPVRLLKDYLNLSTKRKCNKGNKLSLQKAVNKEIAVMRTIIRYIAKYGLASEYPPEDLEKQILELQKKKVQITDPAHMKKPKAYHRSNLTIPSVSYASTMVDCQAEVKPSPKEDLQLDNQAVKAEPSPKEELRSHGQMVKEELLVDNQAIKEGNEASSSSTSRWPALGSLYNSIYEGLSFIYRKHNQQLDSMASSSNSRWPQLKSYCINMDGLSLRMFLYTHLDEQDLLYSEVCDALKYASDPAKLVLDVIPGCLRSQPEYDKSLLSIKVRNSRILLLEQLITISPQISPCVKEEALKMANEWRTNLGKKFQDSGNVSEFLHFIAAYGLTSNFEVEELLGLLLPANYHKASPRLCRSLGLADKAVVLIGNLIQKKLLLEAIEHIYEFEVVDKFPPVRLLKDYLYSKKTIHKCGTKSPSKHAIDTEIDAARTVITCIAKYKLESQYPPEDLEKHIAELERQKACL